jgi:hypothetical protein
VAQRAGTIHAFAIALDEYLADDFVITIDDEYARMWNAVGAMAGLVLLVQDAQPQYRRCIDVRDKRVGDIARFDEFLLFLGRIVSNDDETDAGFREGLNRTLQLPELRPAEGSPVDRAHGQEHRALVQEEWLDAVDFFAVVQRTYRRELRADGQTGIKIVRVFVQEHVVQVELLGMDWLRDGHETGE